MDGLENKILRTCVFKKNDNVRTLVGLGQCVVWVGGSSNFQDQHGYPPKYQLPDDQKYTVFFVRTFL